MSRHSIDNLVRAARLYRGCAITVGNFDGVHAGHQAILGRVARFAEASGVASVALTFEPHPVRFFRPSALSFRLTTPSQKLALLRKYDIETPLILSFDRAVAELEPESFIRTILIEGFAPRLIVVGYDFHFGRERRGSPALLKQVCSAAGHPVEVQGAVEVDGGPVSSTRVRETLADGDLLAVRKLLQRPYALVGEVVHGAGRGKGLGFPTANISCENELLPANGVYCTYLEVDGKLLRAITNIGVRPTFGESEPVVETFILDDSAPQDLDLYGSRVATHLLTRLRPERKFPSADALVAQITQDIERCRQELDADPGEDIVLQGG